MKIVYLANLASPYRVEYWNILSKNADVTVIFERKKALNRDKNWKSDSIKSFKEVYCKGIPYGQDSIISLSPIKYINRSKDDLVIVGNGTSITGILAVLFMRLRRIKYIVEGDGAFVNQKENFVKYLLKYFVFSKAELALSTCANHDEYYTRYGVKKEKIRRYRFSSIHLADVCETPITPEEKREYKRKLNIHKEKMVLYVGQFIYRKGCDILMDAARKLGPDVSVVMIGGDGFSDDVKELVGEISGNVQLLPFMKPHELREYYLAADVFAFPTREDIWGLVVNEAMGYGLPVITTNRCNAGLELIKNKKNGIIVNNDGESFCEAVKSILNKEPDEYAKMQMACLDVMKSMTIENMALDHEVIFDEIGKHS